MAVYSFEFGRFMSPFPEHAFVTSASDVNAAWDQAQFWLKQLAEPSKTCYRIIEDGAPIDVDPFAL